MHLGLDALINQKMLKGLSTAQHSTHPLVENRRCNGTIVDALSLILPLEILLAAYSGSPKFYSQDIFIFSSLNHIFYI